MKSVAFRLKSPADFASTEDLARQIARIVYDDDSRTERQSPAEGGGWHLHRDINDAWLLEVGDGVHRLSFRGEAPPGVVDVIRYVLRTDDPEASWQTTSRMTFDFRLRRPQDHTIEAMAKRLARIVYDDSRAEAKSELKPILSRIARLILPCFPDLAKERDVEVLRRWIADPTIRPSEAIQFLLDDEIDAKRTMGAAS